MAIVVNPKTRTSQWMDALRNVLPEEDLRLWPDIGDPTEIEYMIAWTMPTEALGTFPRLGAILSLGAGTEQFQKPGMPEVPIVGLADPVMADEMAGYALAWVIRHHRGFAESERLQRAGEWRMPPHSQPAHTRIGMLGYGRIGSRIGAAFADLGYPVNAWSTSGGSTPGVTHFAGQEDLDDFLAASDAVINVLPSTSRTRGLLTAARFARFARGSIFVNLGRGSIIADESELLAALDTGPIAAAVLDVTDPEPPPANSPLYSHRAVTLTAHLAGLTRIDSAAQLLAANIGRLRAGIEPFPIVDRARGY